MSVLCTFEELHEFVKTQKTPRKLALVRAEDAHSLEAVARCCREGYLEPVLIGNREQILQTASTIGFDISDASIRCAETSAEAAAIGVEMVRNGEADIIMKGKLESAEMLRPVVSRTDGISLGGVMSHISVNQSPYYHKLLLSTDGGMLPYPTLEQKRELVRNAVAFLHKLGYTCPKVCVLAAVEKVNPKMPETLEAAALKDMNRSGEITGCVVEGPISLDLSLVKERAAVKGYSSPCAGDADILVVPNIHAGNILGKTMVELGGAKMAGLILGAKCPVVLTSRGSSAEEKYNSIIMACAASAETSAAQ